MILVNIGTEKIDKITFHFRGEKQYEVCQESAKKIIDTLYENALILIMQVPMYTSYEKLFVATKLTDLF